MAQAATTYYLASDNTGANTKVSAADQANWVALPPGHCFVAAAGCQSYEAAEMSPSFSWTLGGGRFYVKRSNSNSTVPITLRLWDGPVSGTLAAPVGNVVASVSIAATLVSSSTPAAVLFKFATPYQLVAGHVYTLTLTSPVAANRSFVFKSPQGYSDEFGNLLDPPQDPGNIPEPGTWAMVALGGVVLFSAKRRTNRL